MSTIIEAPGDPPAAQPAQVPGSSRWSSARRILIRVGFLYFGAYALPLLTFPLSGMKGLILLGDVMSPLTKLTARGLGLPTPLSDPFGHVWTIASRVEETTEPERRERWSQIVSGPDRSPSS